jgi:hypothetical protein
MVTANLRGHHVPRDSSVSRSSTGRAHPARSWAQFLLRRLAPGVLLVAVNVAQAAPYQLGQGYPLPFAGLTAGGYISLSAESLEGSKSKLVVQDISLLLHADPSPVWHFFSEIEVGSPLSYSSGGSFSSSDSDLDFERLYVDRNLSARTTLRAGKFLVPIGRWNQIHADPLVWSVSRPLSTSAAFARHAAGVQLYGGWPLRGAGLNYQVYLDDSALLDPTEGQELTYPDVDVSPNPHSSFRHGAGARLLYRGLGERLQVGLSAARFTLKDLPGTKQLVGLDLFYTEGNLELTGEAVYRRDTKTSDKTEWGGFLQLAVPVGGGLYAIASGERYQAELFPSRVDSASLGLTYRPRPLLSIKLERRESWGEKRLAPSGWLLSLAVLL